MCNLKGWFISVWIADIFNKGRATISEHISNIFKEGELEEKVVVRKFRTTTQHGALEGKTQSKEVKYYNLDVIISVGYRVKSIQGTRFRQCCGEVWLLYENVLLFLLPHLPRFV